MIKDNQLIYGLFGEIIGFKDNQITGKKELLANSMAMIIRRKHLSRHIPIKQLERIQNIFMPDDTGGRIALKIGDEYQYFTDNPNIEWVDNNGINTPYLVKTISHISMGLEK